MLPGLDLVKLSLSNDSSLPRWVLPGFDLKELWPAGANKNSTPDSLLLLGCNSLFSRLGNPHFYNSLGRDLNRCTGGRIATHASFAFGYDQFPDPWNSKGAGLLGPGNRLPCFLIIPLSSFIGPQVLWLKKFLRAGILKRRGNGQKSLKLGTY